MQESGEPANVVGEIPISGVSMKWKWMALSG
jgi:hypothetical protein